MLERSVDSESEYEQVFEILCRRYDTPDWDIANLRRALEAEIAERAEISIHAVSIAIDARLSGRGADASTIRNDGGDYEVESHSSETTSCDSEARQAKKSSFAAATDSRPATDTRPIVTASSADARTDESSNDQDEEGAEAGATNIKIGMPARADVKSLRARLWTLASRLAQRNGLGELVHPLSGQGLGFVLRDVPDPALVEQLDEEALARVSMVWWHLAACSELTVAPLDALLPALPEESVLRQALVEQDAGLLFTSIWTLDPGHAGYRLWRRLDERDWQDLLGLMDAYRALHHIAAAANQNLWSLP